ncbi:oligoendopeptidase F [Alteribacter natronophilus]|uniref:oligoendopeptidase F n=1 Tax=Alteribacter natronophilus TaxID=2583810 RepID=UPI00110E9278|nr:oligoendopeptidase F [Alteribacter natronophilus]TMW72865.1 oligoendopeptidase F [Alteribacter natronophilus]
MTTAAKTLTRREVPTDQTWNLTDLFETREAWEEELQAIPAATENVTRFKGQIGLSAQTLFNCLEAADELLARVMRMTTYAMLKQSGDGTNPENQSDAARAGAVASKTGADLAFIRSEILALDDEKLETFKADVPELREFDKTLSDLMEAKPHRLSPDAEEMLAAFGEVHTAPYMIYERSKTSDMVFPDFEVNGQSYPLTFNTFSTYEESADTDVRRAAYEAFSATLKTYNNTYAATLATEVKKQVIESRLRGFDSVTDYLLHSQQVTQEMYHRQLDVIQEELAPIMRRFASLKKRVLGLEKMTYADLKAPLDPEYDPDTTYEEAGKTVLDSLEVMGPEYMEIMERGVKDRWVDLADNVGKRSGAFCSSPYGVHPYILMTWTGSMRDAFTLAHELGHAGHFSLAGRYQRLSGTRPSRYFIEAPSTMNEMLLREHILGKTEDDRMRRWVILQSLGTYYHNFVTHILEGELQRRMYAKADQDVPVTATLLNETKQQVLQDFWGDEVEIDERAGYTWMRQPHYYMGLYPYTYSAGLTASTAAAETFKEEGQPAVDRWLGALKAGGTMKPLDLMKEAGVDMTTDEPVKKAVAYVGRLVSELEESF